MAVFDGTSAKYHSRKLQQTETHHSTSNQIVYAIGFGYVTI
jgi:hypothetical protein